MNGSGKRSERPAQGLAIKTECGEFIARTDVWIDFENFNDPSSQYAFEDLWIEFHQQITEAIFFRRGSRVPQGNRTSICDFGVSFA